MFSVDDVILSARVTQGLDTVLTCCRGGFQFSLLAASLAQPGHVTGTQRFIDQILDNEVRRQRFSGSQEQMSAERTRYLSNHTKHPRKPAYVNIKLVYVAINLKAEHKAQLLLVWADCIPTISEGQRPISSHGKNDFPE